MLPAKVKQVLIAAIIFVSVVPALPVATATGLDSSWIYGINIAHFQRMVFGRDIVFTYGPLGYLIAPVFPWAEPWAEFAFAACIALVNAYALWMLCRRARHRTEVCLFLVVFWVYSGYTLDSQFERPLAAVLALTLAIAIGLDHEPWFDLGLLFVLAAVTLLAKFNIGVIASIVAFYFAAILVWRQRGTPARALKSTAIVLSLWLMTLAGLYWIYDGTLSGLIPFLRTSTEIASGYSEAMGLPGPMWSAVAAVASCLALWIVVPLASGSFRRVIWIMPALIVASFLCFKWAMVRQDAHALPFLFEMAVIALLIVAIASTARSRIVVAAFAAVSIAIGIAQQPERGISPGRVDRLVGYAGLQNLKAYARWPATVAALEEGSRLGLRSDQIPAEFEPFVEGKRVTTYPWEIAMIPANHLRGQLLPVIQAYSAYTPALDSLNAQALQSGGGPEAVLLQWDSIDGRQPFYETPRSWWALFNWYDLKLRSHNWPQSVAVLSRRAAPRFDPPVASGTLIAHWGQNIPLPSLAGDEALMMQADVKENLRGILKRELFRGTPVTVRVTLRSGFIESRRVIRANLAEGVLVSDWPNSLGPAVALVTDGGSLSKDRVVSISLRTYSPADFDSPIPIRWFRVKLRRPVT
jgi:hypothetical protein